MKMGADYLNDLWQYNISTNQWSYLAGKLDQYTSVTSQKNESMGPVYPGSRMYAQLHYHASTNQLIMVGGMGVDANTGMNCVSLTARNTPLMRFVGDIWSFNISSRTWKYVGNLGQRWFGAGSALIGDAIWLVMGSDGTSFTHVSRHDLTMFQQLISVFGSFQS